MVHKGRSRCVDEDIWRQATGKRGGGGGLRHRDTYHLGLHWAREEVTRKQAWDPTWSLPMPLASQNPQHPSTPAPRHRSAEEGERSALGEWKACAEHRPDFISRTKQGPLGRRQLH